MKAEPYDFRKPVPFAVELEHRLEDWLRDACELAPKSWGKHLAFPVQLVFNELEVMQQSDSLVRLPDPAIGYRVPVQGSAMSSLLVISRRLALALVSGLLGELCKQLPADRELTVVEESLIEYLLSEHLVASLQQTWPGAEAVRLGPLKKEPNPKFTRIFLQDDNISHCLLSFQGPFGPQECHWLAPQKGFLELFASTGPGREKDKEVAARPRLEKLVCDLPVEIAVQLGVIDLPFAQLTKLRPGDLVILNQSVAEPLLALVAGERKFQVWPGRVGSRPAFQIQSAIGS